ncbi:MAG: hypothetical protein ACI4T7_04025 [Alloprevotella sp.]
MEFISIAEPQLIFCKVTANQRAIYYPDLGKNYQFFGFCYCGQMHRQFFTAAARRDSRESFSLLRDIFS